MSIDTNLLIALSIIRDECWRQSRCRECPLQDNCINPDNLMPRRWTIPDPPPEPAERQRIEWLRCLPDGEMLDAVIFVYDGRIDYNAGPIDWWHEAVNLEQFRKDVGLE